jgi:hypothetical protein
LVLNNPTLLDTIVGRSELKDFAKFLELLHFCTNVCGFHKVRDREFSKFGTSISESRGQAFQKVADNLTADF